MSIFFVIHTEGSHLQNSPRADESQPTTFFFLSRSYTVTKAREEVSHQAAMPLTRGGKKHCLHKQADTQTSTHIQIVPLQIPINILQDATFPHKLKNAPSPPSQVLSRQVPTQLPISFLQRSISSVQ